MVLFGALFVANHDWLSGAFALISGVATARLALTALRLRRDRYVPDRRAREPESARNPREQRTFVTHATHQLGYLTRDGYVVISGEVAGFVPTTRWRHLIPKIAIGLIASEVPLSELELDVEDSPRLAGELTALIEQRDGAVLDARWSWARRGHSLVRDGRDHLRLEDAPSKAWIERWPSPTAAALAHRRRIGARVRLWFISIAVVFAGAGLVSWRATSDTDFLFAGMWFAGVTLSSVVISLAVSRKDAQRTLLVKK